MFIKQFQLLNYKSYVDSELVELLPGINIIIGKNNSGKTAFPESLTLNLLGKPHRSIQTLPNSYSSLDQKSSAIVKIHLEKKEIKELLEQIPPPLGIPAPSDELSEPWEGDTDDVTHLVRNFDGWLKGEDSIDLELSFSSDRELELDSRNITKNSTFNLYRYLPEKIEGQYKFIKLSQSNDGTLSPIIRYESTSDAWGGWEYEPVDWDSFVGDYQQTIICKIFNLFRNRIYRFYAERLNIGKCTYQRSTELKPDASNLAEVLYSLPNSNPVQFRQLNQYLCSMFQNIAEISVFDNEDSSVEIRIWPSNAVNLGRKDLTLPLSDCGTGIGQVLAILYVIITSQFPRTIIIDEPQSFLHPGAARQLIGILKEFPQHQYIIATHSPMLISAAMPAQIIKLSYQDGQTKISVINSEETREQSSILDDVGVRLSDVFGADHILWVEGPTEERCFPLILERIAKTFLGRTVILAVQATGDLEGKRSEIIFDIYTKLSSGKSLLPPAIGFVFDREVRSKAAMDDLKRKSKNLIDFIGRRMYENYLLDSEAIAFVINTDDYDREVPLSNTDIETWINRKKLERAYTNSI